MPANLSLVVTSGFKKGGVVDMEKTGSSAAEERTRYCASHDCTRASTPAYWPTCSLSRTHYGFIDRLAEKCQEKDSASEPGMPLVREKAVQIGASKIGSSAMRIASESCICIHTMYSATAERTRLCS